MARTTRAIRRNKVKGALKKKGYKKPNKVMAEAWKYRHDPKYRKLLTI
jgi:hypothetical protein